MSLAIYLEKVTAFIKKKKGHKPSSEVKIKSHSLQFTSIHYIEIFMLT